MTLEHGVGSGSTSTEAEEAPAPTAEGLEVVPASGMRPRGRKRMAAEQLAEAAGGTSRAPKAAGAADVEIITVMLCGVRLCESQTREDLTTGCRTVDLSGSGWGNKRKRCRKTASLSHNGRGGSRKQDGHNRRCHRAAPAPPFARSAAPCTIFFPTTP